MDDPGDSSSFSSLKKGIKRRLDTGMDDLRDSLSSLKKGIKRRMKGKKRKMDNPGAGGSEEGIGPSDPPPRPGPAAVTDGGREREGNQPNADDEHVEPSTAPDENKLASASAELLPRGMGDPATAFGPLKAVAGHLFCILENCEVRSPSTNVTHNAHLYCSVRGKTNKR